MSLAGDSTELVVIPTTGELLDLEQESDTLAAWFDQIKELEDQLKSVRARISDELIKRMDSEACWTMRPGRFKVTAPSPEPKEKWDTGRLNEFLTSLMGTGVTQEAIRKALPSEVVWKPSAAGIKALRKVLSPEDRERLDACRELVPPSRTVRVEFER